MQYRTLGRTDLKVSELGVGCAPFGMNNYISTWDASTDEAQRTITDLVHCAVDLGYNYFDVAPAYGGGRSEEMLGVALKGVREKAYVATKIGRGLTGLEQNKAYWNPAAVRQSVEDSLMRMGLDVIDVIQLHGGDYTDGEDQYVFECGTVETLEKLRDEGKVRFLGFTSEGGTGAAERLIQSGAFDTIQITYNLMNQSVSDFEKGNGIIRMAKEQQMGVLPMRPLTGGVFMRLMGRYFPEADHSRMGEMLLNYVLSDPYIDCALVGTRSQARLASNAAISDDVASRLDLVDLYQYFLAKRKDA